MRARSVKKLTSLVETDNKLFNELAKKRSLKFKDPAKRPLACSLNELPTKYVKMLLTPKVIQGD
jgi:hypothetical protein